MTITPRTALTIAGSDSGGGAGIQADIRTFFANGVHPMTAIAAVTVQNSVGVQGFSEIPVEIVTAQIESVATDIGVHAAKTGMLASAEIIEAVGETIDKVGIGQNAGVPFVVDPVAASMHGDPLLLEDALAAIRTEMIPRATVLTPNLDEVRLLTGVEVTDAKTQRDAVNAFVDLGAKWVLIKGGHMHEAADCVDLLSDGNRFSEFTSVRHATKHTHGGGDTFAAAITAGLAKGLEVPAAVTLAKRFIERSVAESYQLGAGIGPVSQFWRLAEEDQ